MPQLHPRSLLLLSGALFAFLPCPSHAQDKKDQKGAGITMAADADPKDIGLPLYPGSRRHVDKDSDSRGLNFDLWGGGSGFKMAILKMESDDSIDKLADYYKKHLSKYGKVLDCSHPSPSNDKDTNDDNDNSKPLTCANDKPDPGGLLFKAGTKSDQHVVSIQPASHGSQFQLIHLAHWNK
jgi:hypothetical protein